MLRLMALVAVCGVLQLATGCRHTGGECDCGPVPGDSVGVNPHLPGYNAHTTATAPVVTTTAAPNNFEPIAPSKTAPGR